METKNEALEIGFGAGNNFLIRHGTNDSTLVTCRLPNRYLAINWQRTRINVPFICADRRFPTPLQRKNIIETKLEIGASVTTNHLLLPRQRRKAPFSLLISQPNSNLFSAVTTPRGGRGGQPSAAAKNANPIVSHGNFIAMALNKNFEEPDRKKAASNEL